MFIFVICLCLKILYTGPVTLPTKYGLFIGNLKRIKFSSLKIEFVLFCIEK